MKACCPFVPSVFICSRNFVIERFHVNETEQPTADEKM